MKNNLPKYWAVKNDGSQLFKDTVIKYLNKNYGCIWYGSENNSYYGYDGNKFNNGTANHHTTSYFKNNPTLLTLEQFIELSKPIEEFVLPEKWYLRGSKALGDYFDKIGDLDNGGENLSGRRTDFYYFISDNNKWDYYELCPEYHVEITFEQFKKYVLKKETMKNKKIIGYKTPRDLFNGSVPKGSIYFKKVVGQNGYHWRDAGQQDVFYLPNEIVETWEPVYEEEKLEIGGYEIFFPCAEYTLISGYKFTKEWWVAAKEVAINSKAKIMVGCSYQFDLSTELIGKVIKRLDNMSLPF